MTCRAQRNLLFMQNCTCLQSSSVSTSLVNTLQHFPVHSHTQSLGEDGVVVRDGMLLWDELFGLRQAQGKVWGRTSFVRRHVGLFRRSAAFSTHPAIFRGGLRKSKTLYALLNLPQAELVIVWREEMLTQRSLWMTSALGASLLSDPVHVMGVSRF